MHVCHPGDARLALDDTAIPSSTTRVMIIVTHIAFSLTHSSLSAIQVAHALVLEDPAIPASSCTWVAGRDVHWSEVGNNGEFSQCNRSLLKISVGCDKPSGIISPSLHLQALPLCTLVWSTQLMCSEMCGVQYVTMHTCRPSPAKPPGVSQHGWMRSIPW
jgi:hypothetical protein